MTFRARRGQPGSVPAHPSAAPTPGLPRSRTDAAWRIAGDANGRATDPLDPVARSAATQTVGWLPVLAVISAFGLMAIVEGYSLSRAGRTGGEPLFWLGLTCIVMPIGWRLLSDAASRAERISLVVVAGGALYLVKVVHSSFGFTFSDEYVHAHNANEILRTYSLFGENPFLPATPDYPGLESSAAALASLSGLSTFAAGLLIVGAARVAIVLALFLLFETLSGSARVAGVASLLYMATPNFLFWSAQFSYESLALPLAVAVLYGIARWTTGLEDNARRAWRVTILLTTVAVVVTHHMTTYALVVFLAATSLVHLVVARRPRRGSPWPFALFAAIIAAEWLLFVASETVGYLTPVFTNAVESAVETLRSEAPRRTLFTSTIGVEAPPWERVTGFASVGLIALGMPFGLLAVWKRYRRDSVAVVLAFGGAAYLGTFALRFAPGAWEVANRASEFLFIGVAFLLALTGVEQWRPRRIPWAGQGAAVAAIGIIFAGGVIAGWPRDQRLAQPYVVAVGSQTIEPEGREVARWSRQHLGRGRRFAADISNGRLLLVQGRQFVRAGTSPPIDLVIRLPNMDPWETELLADERIRYVLIDRRYISGDAMVGNYFTTPTSPAIRRFLYPPVSYRKFDRLRRTSRVFDSGDIVIYDVRQLVARARAR
jgi:hypothetical protein